MLCFRLQCGVQNELTFGSVEQIAYDIIVLFKSSHLTHMLLFLTLCGHSFEHIALYVPCPLTQTPCPQSEGQNLVAEYTHGHTHLGPRMSIHFYITPELQSVLSVSEPRGNTISNQPERKLSGDEIYFSSFILPLGPSGFHQDPTCLFYYLAKRYVHK